MARESRPIQIQPGELGEKLTHLEYVVENTKKAVTSFKNDKLKDQTEDFLKLMEIVKDAVGLYRDEVADLMDME